MASSGTIVCIIYAFGITVGVANSYLGLDYDETNMGLFGQKSTLKCIITQNDVKVRVIIWRKMGQENPLLVFEDTMKVQVDGFRFAHPYWNPNNMDLSLLIDNTKVEDEGDYECTVVTDGGDKKMTTHLKVKARYNRPTIEETKEPQISNAESALTCESVGGYPEGKLRWFDEHDKDWTQSSNMTIKKMESGLFKISSQLPLFPGSTYEKYSCKVYDNNGVEEDKVSYETNRASSQEEMRTPSTTPLMANEAVKSTKETTVIAPVVVIGSLIVGLLFVLVLVYRRRNQARRRPSTTPLMGHHESVETRDPDVETGDPVNDV